MSEQGKQVAIEYTVRLENGKEVDTNVGSEPLVYEQGAEQILPALEKQLSNLKAGETKQVTLPPAQAYGEVRVDAFQKIDKKMIPEDAQHVGAVLAAQDERGNRRQVRVHEVKSDAVVIDLNHPLAGKTLTFEVKVLEIR